MNDGKLLHEESKRELHVRATAGQMNEIQIPPVIESHDLATKCNQAIQFLCDPLRVRVKLHFRGRQSAPKEVK